MPERMELSVEQKRGPFARKTPSQHLELVGLFHLLDALHSSDIKTALSHYTREKLRETFPQGALSVDIVELANGLKVEVDTGDLFGAEFFLGHCNEARVISAISQTLPEAARVIDVGANFGAFALHAAYVAGRQCRTIAFEPAPTAHRLLVANVTRNGLEDRIDVRRMAVGATPGATIFHVAADESFSGLRATGRSPLRESIDIALTSLDNDVGVKALGPIDFLKIDTEGGEGEVLDGARETIARSPSIVVLMEYSAKNLTDAQAKIVRSRVSELIKEGLETWVIGADDLPVGLPSAEALPLTFSGSLLLARRASNWGQSLLSSLRKIEGRPYNLKPPIAAALEGLMERLRATQIQLSTEKHEAAALLRKQSDAFGALLDSKETDIAQLNSKLVIANNLSANLREALTRRQSGFDQLEQVIRELQLNIRQREQIAKEEATAHASTSAELAAARAEIKARSDTIAGLVSERDRLEAEHANLLTDFEKRRDVLRALQQEIALFKLGRIRRRR